MSGYLLNVSQISDPIRFHDAWSVWDMAALIDITGQRFGRLVAIERVGFSQSRSLWRCCCDCGAEATVRISSLRNGDTQSCGCLYREAARRMGEANVGKSRNRTHGLCDLPEYGVWLTMRSRCFNPKVASYKSYGGRGIRVCERWSDFENFYADMGPRPEGVGPRGYTLYSVERIDNDGHYEPDNCYWATAQQQAANKRTQLSV